MTTVVDDRLIALKTAGVQRLYGLAAIGGALLVLVAVAPD